MIGGTRIHQKECFVSSMDWAKEQCKTVPDGTVFLADTYHVARGRQGRVWQLAPGQMILTFVLKPVWHDKTDTTRAMNYLNMALTCGVTQTLQAIDTCVGIKWPNDFVIYDDVSGRHKKLGGILLEAVWHETRLEGIVVGIAINCTNEFATNQFATNQFATNQFATNDPLHKTATSIKTATKKTVSGDELREQLVCILDAWYEQWKRGEFETIFLSWKKFQLYMYKDICVHYSDKTFICGIMQDVDRDGNLIVLDDKDVQHTVSYHHIILDGVRDFK